ncbi:DNA replication and repair protein RecF [Quadrisphaera granulorum]|uniref:DNA replication and repair protein RecF n=1 Tax=Quadrisphaera granulorum TaxID=317664 RepID=A0A316AZU1_9ACTN|nr:DNA replication/repair protein RecF [Quadrisphaera granulorum]PWJ55757.1 DNA replication and repair protein RecF [Quadrisphaera granulorum]SZE95254.1 DNA replication and repair protein RecF [Quadrisphaera granulorum]
MHVTHLSLVDFRNYTEAEVELGPGPTALVGPNGQGKTNLVEAVGYVATLGSHRAATDAPLVRAGAARAVVRAAVDRAGRSTLVEVEISPGRANRARLNRSPLQRPRDVLGSLRTVLFAPEDLALVKGDPDGRRRFMDDALVALAPRLAGVKADLDRVLKQRGALLRQAASTRRGGRSRTGGSARARERAAQAAAAAGWDDAAAAEAATLDVWDTHLAAAGAELLAARLLLVRRLHPHVARAYAAVSGAGQTTGQGTDQDVEGPVRLAYRSSLPLLADLDLASDAELPPRAELAQALLEQMAQVRTEELERGTSLVGPQRDDLLLELSGLPARGYASHGESWSYALALRLGLYELLSGEGPKDPASEPVLVLDDVFAELDAGRRQRLAALVAPAEQVLITAAVAEDVPPELAGRRLQVRSGTVEA